MCMFILKKKIVHYCLQLKSQVCHFHILIDILFDDLNKNYRGFCRKRTQSQFNNYVLSIKIYFDLKQTLNTVSKERSFWKQRRGETSQIGWSSVIVSFPNKNRCINFLQIYQIRYQIKKDKINRVFQAAFLQKLYCTCSSWYKIKIFLMKISSNPYFDDDVFWHEVVFLFLVKRHLFNTKFAISYQIVNIMEMFKILSWLIEEVTNWRVWNK